MSLCVHMCFCVYVCSCVPMCVCIHLHVCNVCVHVYVCALRKCECVCIQSFQNHHKQKNVIVLLNRTETGRDEDCLQEVLILQQFLINPLQWG